MADLSMVLSSLMEIKEDIGKLKQAHEVSEQDRAETRTSIREINASVRELRAAQEQTLQPCSRLTGRRRAGGWGDRRRYRRGYKGLDLRELSVRISQRGVDLIKRHEGLRLQAYRDAVGVVTIGYGHTRTARIGQVISPGDAEALLRADLDGFELGVARLVTRPINQSQFDALVSFAFNVGLDIDADRRAEGLGDSTLLALVNAGCDQEAAIEFLKWNKAGGRPLLGLTRRRLAEAQLFLEDL